MKKLLFTLALLILTSAASANSLPFIEDDYAKAITRAKANNVPVFVEAWAPW
ncbi:MAG: hypothetical protein WA208_02075 [Thermoanaerobaculia bacterium]